MKRQKSYYSKLVDSQKELHNEQVDEIINKTNNDHLKINEFKIAKKMKWWSCITSLAIAVFITGLAFLIGALAINSPKAPNYQATGWTSLICGVLLIIAILIIGWVKNNHAKNYFNDKRRRYQHTFTLSEAKLILTNKILFLGLILTIPTIIATNVCFNG